MPVIRIYPQSLYEAGIKENALQYAESHGFEVTRWEVVYNDTVFLQVKNIPETLPEHIELSNWTFS